MNEADTITIIRTALFVTLVIIGPVLLAAIVVGLTIALFQAVTQIQVITLTFVPKIVVVIVSLYAAGPFMYERLSTFVDLLADRILLAGTAG